MAKAKRYLAAAWAMLALSVPAAAQPTDVDADLRCIAIISVSIGQSEGEARTNLVAGMMYFIGKVDGEKPGIDLKVELKRTYEALTQEIAKTEGQRCSDLLVQKGQRLQQIGDEVRTGK